MSNCSDSIPIQNRIIFGKVVVLATISDPGKIQAGNNFYTYYNHDNVYHWLNINDPIYFFQCPLSILDSYTRQTASPSHMLAFNLHMYNNANNYIVVNDNIGEGDDVITTTTTDLPPPMVQNPAGDDDSLYQFLLTDCGEIILGDNVDMNIAIWTRVNVFKTPTDNQNSTIKIHSFHSNHIKTEWRFPAS